MKKTALLIASLLLCFGFIQAQDVYFSGNHNGTGKIWKNNTLVYSISDTVPVHLSTMRMAPDSSVYTAGYSHDTTFDFVQGRLWLNDSLVFNAGSNTAINSLILNENGWTAAGVGENEWENVTGLVWQNGAMLYAYSDSIHSNQINALTIDTLTGDVYSGGISAELESKATVWKNDTILWREDSVSAIYAIAFDGTNLFAAGNVFIEGQPIATLWQNDSIVFQISDVDIESGFDVITLYNNSIYLAGYVDDSMYVWQDGEVLFAHPRTGFSEIKDLVVNEAGVYYVGQSDNMGIVWKDGEILYQQEDCEEITSLVVLPIVPTPVYTLTVEADTTGWGTVSGGGEYHLGDTATIEAFPNMGCEFLFWNDGVTDNPRDIVVTQDSTFTAYFCQIGYLIVTEVSPAGSGTVTSGGIYHYGDTLMLEAMPNVGYEFLYWNDDVTDNPREIVVTQDSTFTAYFGPLEYLIETEVTPAGSGTVTGGGIYHYGDTLTLEALPHLGYEFIDWADGNTTNPRTVIVTENHTYTAQFGIQQCSITAEVTPAGAGTVDGQGIYSYGSTIHLLANNNIGFAFAQWSDGVVENPRTILVQGDAHYIAEFDALEYEISTSWEPEEGGTVSGGGIYHYGDTASLVATANPNFSFICWSDGIATNPRNVIVTKSASYKALFYHNGTPQYTVNVLCNDPLLGIVTGGGVYPEGSTIEISARPNDDAIFLNWDDGNTDNPRQVTVVQDTIFTALFERVEKFTIEVLSENLLMGSVYGGGSYIANQVVNIGAIPRNGFIFAGWQDGDMSNPRSITVTENATYTAYFADIPIQSYTITVYFDENQGFVLGGGTYEEGSTATLAAIPADDYVFVKWSDDNTDNPRNIVVNQDLVLAAFFNTTGVEEYYGAPIHLYPNPASDYIHLEGLEQETEISIFNAQGLMVKTLTINGDADLFIGDLASGLYLMRLDKRQVKFMKR